jgi:hypothetical protein
MIKQDPRSFLDLTVPDLINGVSIEESRLMMQKLVVRPPVGEQVENLLKGENNGSTTDKSFFVVLAHKPSLPGTWDFAKKYHFLVGFPQVDNLITTLLNANAQGIIQQYKERQELPKFRSNTLQEVERRLREELKGFGGGKTKFNPITGMKTADLDGGVPLSASQHCWVKPGTDATTNETHMVWSQGDGPKFSVERAASWGSFWAEIRTSADSSFTSIIEQFDYKDKEFPLVTMSAPVSSGFFERESSFRVGFPETMKVEVDETIGSQLLVSEVIAAVPCDLKGIGIPQELESGLPGFVAHDLSNKTKEFAYLTVLFLGICPAQAIYRGSVLLGLGIDLEGKLYNVIKDRLSGLTEDQWWRYLLGMCRGEASRLIYMERGEALVSTVNKSIDGVREVFELPKEYEARGSAQMLRQALEHEMSELLETCCIIRKKEGETIVNAFSIFRERCERRVLMRTLACLLKRRMATGVFLGEDLDIAPPNDKEELDIAPPSDKEELDIAPPSDKGDSTFQGSFLDPDEGLMS